MSSIKEESLVNNPHHNYVPLDSNLLRDLDTTGGIHSSILSSIEDLIKQIVKDTQKYITSFTNGDISKLDESYILTQAENLKNAIVTQFELQNYDRSIKISKTKIKDNMRRDAQLDEEQLEELADDNISDMIEKDYYSFNSTQQGLLSTVIKSNADYQLLKNVVFIVNNPEDPIPDEEDDEELNVAGGKVSLKDPISLQYFQDPVCSKRCKHTFEKSSIQSHFSKGGSNCPIDGCSQTITRADLYPDQLMRIRVSIYKKLEEKEREEDDDLERVI
ncbi:zinc-finger of the MIZ type in Nse subunit-domain-containing protein [Scheffersomyces coipomensis]|uniref:zinc-finger of the MIZ type in Nse subunit-domain-containing protein n=1 Tax=Scheffersomyces coipomensis TaxID=1788519 RepID=UPI00315CE44E